MNYYILLFTFISFHVEACPTTSGQVWTELGNYCYHVSMKSMNWTDSRDYCRGQGGYLAEIMSKEEETLLDTFLVTGYDYWIGLSDLKDEGEHLNLKL